MNADAMTIVWAFQPLDELEGKTEFVECDEALARRLIDADLVDDPRVGAHHLRYVQADARKPTRETPPAEPEPPAQTYATRELRAAPQRPQPPAPLAPQVKRKPGRPRKVR